MSCSPIKWCRIPSLAGSEPLPVAADVAHQLREQSPLSASREGTGVGASRPRLLVLSPHPDDAALSVGGLLHSGAAHWERHVATLVGPSAYQWSAPKPGVNLAAVTERRRAEDRRYAALLGLTLHAGTLPDAPLRRRDACPFRPPTPDEVGRFTEHVGKLVKRLRPRLLLAPRGIGGHADHLAAREAGIAVADHQRVQLLLYEDLPYAAQEGMEEPGDLERWTLAIGGVMLSKLASLAAYPSQFELTSMQRTLADHAWDGITWVERFRSLSTRPPTRATLQRLGLRRRECRE